MAENLGDKGTPRATSGLGSGRVGFVISRRFGGGLKKTGCDPNPARGSSSTDAATSLGFLPNPPRHIHSGGQQLACFRYKQLGQNSSSTKLSANPTVNSRVRSVCATPKLRARTSHKVGSRLRDGSRCKSVTSKFFQN